MRTPLNILFLADGIHPFTIGGMQKHSSEMVYGLLEAGCSVTLIFSVDHNQKIPADSEIHEKLALKAEMIPKLSLKGLNFPAPGKLPGHYLRESHMFSKNVFSYIQAELSKFDFVFAQGFTAWNLLENKAKSAKIPPVGVHFHGLNMFQKTFGWKANMIAKMFRKPVEKNLKMADYVFSYGGKFKEIYKRLGIEKKCIFQPICVDSENIKKKIKHVHRPLRFVFIGRNDRVKGLDVYHNAIRKIPEGKFSFTFIGDIPLRVRLNRKDCFYEGKVTEERKNVRLAESDVLVCSSYSEGMPFVILEAMADGLIILSTNVGAVSEMSDYTNGILVPPSDEQKLLEGILQLSMMSDSDLDQLKRNSLEKAGKFERRAVIQHLVSEITKRISIK